MSAIFLKHFEYYLTGLSGAASSAWVHLLASIVTTAFTYVQSVIGPAIDATLTKLSKWFLKLGRLAGDATSAEQAAKYEELSATDRAIRAEARLKRAVEKLAAVRAECERVVATVCAESERVKAEKDRKAVTEQAFLDADPVAAIRLQFMNIGVEKARKELLAKKSPTAPLS
ncbi:uncharacterized protein KY384_008061 [Bacidia gigantensis]|uniref:uncharacterized protein n=1 Tax=Bacidia gigantensis TaxID=2732470 RepID=UPI001D036ACE|nr:uncharacterized protein KY384_008061 [Bacidia gigantensis]KAG8527317.1 hypothetical protein KY384_008061 [Bacidia gigantensis]